MNVLFLSRLFYPHIGGVEKHVLEISKILVEKGHKITIITEQYSRDLPKEEDFNGIRVLRIFTGQDDWFKKFRIWKELFKLKKLIRNASIVHCHDVFFWYFPFLFLYPKKKVYVTFHGYEDYPIPKKAVLVRRLSEKLSKGNICIGDFMKKWYGTEPTFVTYGGVDKYQISNIKYQKDERLKDPNSAVFVGRLDEQTGIKTYLKAFKMIKKKIKNFKLLVVGDGKFKKHIVKNVRGVGFQLNPEKYIREYRFAFVSRYLSILEAFVSKRLVFAVYDNPLKEDYLKMSPFAKYIIVARNSKKLSDAVFYFLNNPNEEKKMLNKAYNWVNKQTWEKVTDTYLNLWGFKTENIIFP
ncbi:MAG: glycosyltransferase family 4 protein [Candidatus Levybacteria bacterium]|nr:glycosyltransferase family 4 protein [Candidatus Levybacteria bacterium]